MLSVKTYYDPDIFLAIDIFDSVELIIHNTINGQNQDILSTFYGSYGSIVVKEVVKEIC